MRFVPMDEKGFPRLLDKVHYPEDMRGFTIPELYTLAEEVRQETIHAVAQTGGHLGAGLGVVELTVALHYVFNTPEDKLVWDVGHQTYPHKILTGRKGQMSTLRQPGGLSGFTKRKESSYDTFGAGHSSTSLSAALGMAVARDLAHKEHEVIAVIGDGALSAGMAYEAMNNAGAQQARLIIILNDNKMSISPAVGAMSNYLSRLIASRPYFSLRNMAKHVIRKLPDAIEKAARKTERYTKDLVSGGNFFEEMGCYYIGPVDGHNLNHLVPILKSIRDNKHIDRPILIHAVTEKGRGYKMPEAKAEKLHAVSTFDISTGKQKKSPAKALKYQDVFANALIEEAELDDTVVAITAAMPSGTGIDKFAMRFPERTFDVGIAEQHAVTFAAALAAEGYKPFCAIYSTFLQRAYDQIVHDVAIQRLPVRFAIDRAGLVGADGPTHAGSFDIAFLSNLPDMVVMAAADEAELMHMVATAVAIEDRPSAFRYPRGEGRGIPLPVKGTPLTVGKGRIIKEGNDVAILSFGARLETVEKAALQLAEEGIRVTIADARFAKPLDTVLIQELVKGHRVLFTIEEGAKGGFGAHVMHYLAEQELLRKGQVIKPFCFPDRFIEHNTPEAMYREAGLDVEHIVAQVKNVVGKPVRLKLVK